MIKVIVSSSQLYKIFHLNDFSKVENVKVDNRNLYFDEISIPCEGNSYSEVIPFIHESWVMLIGIIRKHVPDQPITICINGPDSGKAHLEVKPYQLDF